METSNSDAIHVVLHAQHDMWGLGPMETSNAPVNHAVLGSQNDRWGLGLIETCISGPKAAVLQAKTTNEVWNTLRLVILVLKSLRWVQ